MKSRKVSSAVLLNIVLIVLLIGVGVFGYFYYIKANPVDQILSAVNASEATPTQYQYSFSIYGQDQFSLRKPEGVAYGANKIWVADTQNRRVVVFDYNGKPIMQFGNKSADKIKLLAPVSLLVEEDRVLVVDAGLRNIVSYDLQGNLLGYFGEKMVPFPVDIVKYKEYYAVLDQAGPGVIFLSAKGESIQRTLAGYGEKEGMMRFPQKVAVDGDKLIVVDANNNRLQYLDDIKGPFKVRKFKEEENLGVPFSILIKNGYYYVGTSIGKRVDVYKIGEQAERIAGLPNPENDDENMGVPVGIASDSLNRIYVADIINSRIMVYTPQL